MCFHGEILSITNLSKTAQGYMILAFLLVLLPQRHIFKKKVLQVPKLKSFIQVK